MLLRGFEGRVEVCLRLLPSTGPTMLRDTFRVLLEGKAAPEDPCVWESSRFALDIASSEPRGAGGIALGTYELFAGVIEFGLSRRLRHIVTVTDLRMERILRRAGWPLEGIGEPHTIGATRALAGYLEVSKVRLNTVPQNGGIEGPVLWAPVLVVRKHKGH
ncbi:acyl-homoserine-lactone synthase [Mesorhizobium sp. M0019]|uniref:acyl-homoserine-lactone synthase n=1 Tax=Mesorhizobium sp. M0019 TaxID=2956845 RepID=UPI003337D720